MLKKTVRSRVRSLTTQLILGYFILSSQVLLADTMDHVDAFTQNGKGGNRTAVSIDLKGLKTEKEMIEIAIEMSYPESVFIRESEKADFRLIYYSQTGERVPFCGHASIGALYTIQKNNLNGKLSSELRNSPGKHSLTIETDIGIIPMNIVYVSPAEVDYQIEFDRANLVLASEYSPAFQNFPEQLGMDIELFDGSQPVQVDKGKRYVYFSVPSRKALENLTVDLKKAKALSVQSGTLLYCALTVGEDGKIYSRVFAPQLGVDEDPFTGSAQGGLASYVIENQRLPTETPHFFSIQKTPTKDPGEALLEPLYEEGRLKTIILHAKATFVKQTIK